MDRRVHRRVPTPEYEEQILPLAAPSCAGCDRVLDVGCGDGQISRLLAGSRCRRSSASIRRGTRSAWRGERGGGPAYVRAGGRRAAVRRRSRSTPSSPASCSSTSTTSTTRSPRSPGCCARRAVLLLPQPPAAADAGQRLDRRPHPRPARAVLADRAVPRRAGVDRGGGEGRVHPLHPPTAVSRYVNALQRTGWCSSGWSSRRRPHGFLDAPPSTRTAYDRRAPTDLPRPRCHLRTRRRSQRGYGASHDGRHRPDHRLVRAPAGPAPPACSRTSAGTSSTTCRRR